jgi:hypothetical protein
MLVSHLCEFVQSGIDLLPLVVELRMTSLHCGFVLRPFRRKPLNVLSRI